MLNRTLSITLMALFLAIGFNGHAQDKEALKIIDNDDESTIGQYSNLAIDLVKFGYENNSAISLVQAAAIFTAIPVNTLTLTDTPEGTKTEVVTSEYSYDPNVLMSDAKTMAQNDKDLLAYITSVERKMSTKGEAICYVDMTSIRIAAGDTRIVYLSAPYPETKYRISALGDGTNLKMSVYTVRGDEFKGSSEGISPNLAFWSLYKQQIKITIKNNGGRSNDCDIVLERLADVQDRIDQVETIANFLSRLLN